MPGLYSGRRPCFYLAVGCPWYEEDGRRQGICTSATKAADGTITIRIDTSRGPDLELRYRPDDVLYREAQWVFSEIGDI